MQTLTKKPMKLPPRNAMVQLTDPDTGKARKMKALGQAARRIYRKQILAGTDPAFVLPRELQAVRCVPAFKNAFGIFKFPASRARANAHSASLAVRHLDRLFVPQHRLDDRGAGDGAGSSISRESV